MNSTDQPVPRRSLALTLRLVPIRQPKRRDLPFGLWAGKVAFADGFDESDAEVAALFDA